MVSFRYWIFGAMLAATACKPKENAISLIPSQKLNFIEKSVVEYLDTFARNSVQFIPISTELTDSISFVENIDFLMEYHQEETDLVKNQIKYLDNNEVGDVHLPEASNTMSNFDKEYTYLKMLKDSFVQNFPNEIAAYLYLQKGNVVDEDGSVFEQDYWVHVDKNRKVLNISTQEIHNLDLHIIEFDDAEAYTDEL